MPAVMSSRVAPCWTALRMSELMKAEQCSPNFRGALAVSAMSPISAALRMLRSPWARLLEEGARAGRAGLVHRVVDRHPVLEEDVLRVLAADLEDRVHVLGEVGRTDRVGDDLVVDALGLEEDAEDLARGARRRGQGDAYRRVADSRRPSSCGSPRGRASRP